MRRIPAAWWSVSLLLICNASIAGKETRQVRDDQSRFVGAINCQSSSCHGGAGEKRSQSLTWSRQDFHSRACAILLNARSARIAEAAGVGQAESSARCTVCHSPFQSVAQTQLTSSAHPDEGVSCENCHGAAASWLRGHTRPDWTHAMRISAGMRELRNLYSRANACVACHQNIDADLLKAGHPALVFELDSQSMNQPKHWREEDSANGPRSWLVGQAVALREVSWALTQNPSQTGSGDSLVPKQSALVWLLDKIGVANDLVPEQPRLAELSAFAGVQKRADEIARRATAWNATPGSMMSIVHGLAESDSEFVSKKERSVDSVFERAQRLTLALDRLSDALNIGTKMERELNALREDVKRHYDFDTAAFAEHLRAFRKNL